MKSKTLDEIIPKWSGKNLNEKTILIYGKDGTEFKSLEEAVKAGEYHPTLKLAEDLIIDDLNGLQLTVTKKDDLKEFYKILKNWFGDTDSSNKTLKPTNKSTRTRVIRPIPSESILEEGTKLREIQEEINETVANSIANNGKEKISKETANKLYDYYYFNGGEEKYTFNALANLLTLQSNQIKNKFEAIKKERESKK